LKFSTYLLEQNHDDISTLIEGETLSLSDNMSIEDIFKGRIEFRNDISKQLDQYGLEIYNANIQQHQIIFLHYLKK